MTRALLALALVLLAGPASAQQALVPPDPFAPMNLLMTPARLAEVKAAVAAGDPLAVAARDQVLADADPYLARDPDPIVGVLKVPGYYTRKRAQQQAIARRLRQDAWGAHALALAFALTDDRRYGDQAERYLFAWVQSLTRPVHGEDGWLRFVPILREGDTALVMSYSFPSFFYAYDLLRGLGWIDPAEQGRFEAWLRPFVDYHRDEVSYRDNAHAWQALFLAAAAHVTGDAALFQAAVDQHRRGLETTFCDDGTLGRELLRGERAATYTLMALEAMLQLVAIAERHGATDLRDAAGTRTPLRTRLRTPRSLRDGVNRLTDFEDDPATWQRAHRLLLPSHVNGPARPTEWGWVHELAFALWDDPRDLSHAAEAPYGLQPARAYTLAFATLHFRPLAGARSPLAR